MAKWRTFDEEMPELHTNILYANKKGHIGITNFCVGCYKHLLQEDGGEPFLVPFSSVDDDDEMDLEDAEYWCYISDINLPKNKKEKK